MPKQLNVNLAFTADTGAAKAQIKSLEQDLKNLVSATGATKDFKLTKDLVQAKEAAGQLRLALQNATTSTGTLDLSKFDQAIRASGMKLSEYRQHLSSLGPAGQQAFAKMAQSIIQAEVPLRKTNALLDNLKTTMINTARWQLSSSMLHGFMGALQSAYGYAQDLNSSLNNIRIVTGASVDEMTVFADRANKAAQALSTSTTQYTDAALIYYQQGIRDQEEIAGRTETTIKLANVSRQSAEEVSQQMTAIWNNFYDGSKSLEYYADAITALGATTASSSQEIATGLEKFAAISKTVGLSYEYATAALATITAQTRQSADTVGTGLRTLFSRLEGLKLGETLEDGVDLNKYSQALEAVGVQVLDVSGEMRNMDDILDDLGDRWDDLTQAQKVALAQTVGGVRQYTNLIALMDNWDKMQQNVLTAQGSEGTLQEQADIYAESWEAAQKRVKAAAQALYSDLLDDKFFIGLANGFAKILQGIDGLIDGIGGLRTILPGVLLLFNQLWGKQMAQNIDNMIFNMSRNTEAMQQQIAAQKQEAYTEASAMFKGADTNMGQAQEQALKSQLDLSFQLQGVAKNLTAEEIQRYQASIDIVSSIQDQVIALGKAADEAERAKNAQMDQMTTKAMRAGTSITDKKDNLQQSQVLLQDTEQQYKGFLQVQEKMQNLDAAFREGKVTLQDYDLGLRTLQQQLLDLGFDKSGATVTTYNNLIKLASQDSEKFLQTTQKIIQEKGLEADCYIDLDAKLADMASQYNWTDQEIAEFLSLLEQSRMAGVDFAQGMETATNSVNQLKEKITSAETAIQTLGTTGQTIVTIFSTLSQMMMGISSIFNVFETLSNPDASGLEKFKTVIMGLGMGLPMVYQGGIKLYKMYKDLNTAVVGVTAAMQANKAVENENLIVTGLSNLALKLKNVLHTEAIGKLIAETAAQWGLNIAMDANPVGMLIIAFTAFIAVLGALIGITKALSAAWNAHNTAAENAETAAENLQQQFQDTKQAYDDLKTSIEDYQGSLNAIEQLQKGTQEWKEAIRDSNTEALALIDSLGLIKDADYTIDKDGIIKINEDVLDKALDKKAQVANTAQTSALMGQATAKQTRTQADAENIARDSGQYAVVNTAIDRLVNGDLKDQFSKNALSDDELKQKLDINDDELIASIKENAQAQLQAADQYTMASEQAAKSIVDTNKEIQNSGYAEEITKAAGNIYEQAYNASYDKYAESLSLGISETVFDQFAQLSGLDQLNGFKSEGGGKYSYVDESGERQKAEATAEEIAMTLAAADAERQLSETSSGLIGAFKKLDEAGTVGSKALKKFLTDGDLNKLKASELNEMASLTQNGASTKQYLGSQFGGEDNALSDEEAQALGYESARAMVEAFNDGLHNAQDNIADAGKDLIPKFMQDAFDAVSKNSDLGVSGKTAIATAIDSALESGGNEAAKKLMNQFMELSQAGELTDEKIEEIIASAEDLQTIDLATLTNQIAEINKILSDLETGDSISADDYAKLSAEQQNYFAMAMDGTYQLIGSAEELRDITAEANFEKFKQMGAEAADTASTYTSASDIASSSTQGVDALSQSAYMGKGPEGSTAFDSSLLETQLGLLREYQGELDISNAKLAEWQEQLQNNTIDPAMLRDVASAVGDINLSEEALAQGAADATAKQQELQTAMALSAENTNELQAMFEDGTINSEAFNKGLEKIHNTLDEDIDKEQYEDLSDYFENFGDEIKGVSKEMKGNKKASRELAKEIARFDAATKSVGENYEDWMKDLKKGDKSSTTHAKTIKGLRNAYGDLLDVSGDTLSKNFLENAENLDLMARAAEGDEEAYNQLQNAVREDIAAQAHFDDDQFQADFDELLGKYYEGQNLDDIEVGASLNDEGFLQGLTNMVNQAGMTAQQATDYLASMGVDAEVITDSSPTTETTEVVGYNATAHTASQPYSIPKISGSGADMSVSTTTGTATFPYFTVSEDVNTVTTTKENSATSLKVTSASKSSGGGFKASHSGGGGGSCFVAGTQITTINGFKSIENIQPGDIVLSYNEQTKQNEYSKVLQTMIHYLWVQLHKIYIENEIIQVTEIHRFYIKRAGKAQWLQASELRAGDLMYLASGEWKAINNIKIIRRFRKVYNFEVSNNHNYYVTKTQILAHNKGGCFIAGTLVTTDQGFKNIEQIKIGDTVLSYNEITQTNVYSKVAETMIHFVLEPIYTLYIANETLKVTGIHRFFIKRNNSIAWIHASELQEGDFVLFANGTWNQILKIENRITFRKVYNFEVSNTHNYYVGQNQILAHNKGGRGRRGGRARRAEHIRAEVEEKKLKDEGKERYHVITTQLEKINGQLNKVSTAYDRAFGKEKLKLLDEQIAKQQDLIGSQKKYVKEIEKYNKLDTKNLTKGTKTYWSETEAKFKQVSANASKSKTFSASSTIDADGINATSGKSIKKGKGKAKGKGKKKKLTNSKKKNRTGRRRTTRRGTRARVTSRDRAGKGGGRKGSSRRRARRTSSKSSSQQKFNSYLELDPIFDDNGVIVNYDELIEANNKAYNKAMAQIDKESQEWVKKINDARDKAAKSGKEKDEERAKQLEEDFEKWRKAAEEEAQAQYDAFIDFFNQYEETQALLEEERQKLIDQQNALYDMQLEKVTLTVQLKVDIAEDKLKLLENLLEQVGDKAYNTAKRLALIGQQLQADQSKLNAYKEGIAGIFENHGIENGDQVLGDFFNGKINAQDLLQSMSTDGSGNHFTEAEADYFREAADAALAYNSSVIEMRAKVVEEIGNVMDDNAEKLDRITNKMDYLKNVANSYKNIIDLTGRSFLKVSTQVYDEIEKTNVQLATQSLEMAKGRKEQAMAQYQELLSKYASIQSQLSDQEKDLWKEQIKVAEDAVQEQTQNFYSSWEEAIEAVNTRFESMMNNISEDFSRTMAGQAGNLEGLQQKMSLKKDVADVYLPSYERIYQLTKLTNEAQKAIDQSNNVKVQKELEKVQQKILDAKKSGNDLSKYDIEYLTKELELKKAQMALEEAEQVKSQVRMTRDSEGNFSYVYTADEQAVEDAEADYNAKLYEMQKLNEEYIVSLQDQLVSLEQDYISAIQEAASIYGQGTVEYEEAVMQINEDYNQYFGNLKEQLDGALANQLETQQEHAKIYVELTGDVDQANANVTTAWEETMLQQQTGFETLAEYQAAWETSTSETLAAVQQANEDWKTGMETVYEEAGYSLTTHGENTQTFSEQVQGALQNIAEEGKQTKEDMDAMLQQTSQAFTDVTDGVLAWEAQYSAVIDANIQKNNEFVASINDLLLAWSGFEDEITGSPAFPEFADTVESVGDAVNAALDQIRASLDAAQQRYDEAKARRTAARTRKDRARRALGRRLRRAEARVTRARRRVRDAETRRARARSRVDRARKSVDAAKRALRDARGRRARAAARRALRRAQRTLTRAKRTLRRANTTLRRAKRNLRTQEKRLRTAVRRASRRERQKWRTYQTAIKTYRRTVTEQKEAKANLDYWKNQYNEAKTLGEQAIAEAKAQEAAQQQEAEAQGAKVITPEVNLSNADTTALTDKVSSAVDTNTQAFLDAVQKMSITPTVNVDLPKDLNQHVTFDKIEFPSVVNKDEILAALSTLLSKDAASQFANRV